MSKNNGKDWNNNQSTFITWPTACGSKNGASNLNKKPKGNNDLTPDTPRARLGWPASFRRLQPSLARGVSHLAMQHNSCIKSPISIIGG